MPVTSPDGVEISWERTGDGPPVLLVHGFGSSAAGNWAQTGWVRALTEAGRTAIAVDLRGHGASGKPRTPAEYRLELLVADLVSVLDAAEVEAADVLAYSMGGLVGLELARRHPSRVRRIVVGGTGAHEAFAQVGPGEARAFAERGVEPADPVAREVLAMTAAPGNEPAVLAACVEGLAGARPDAEVPAAALVVAGSRDSIADSAAALAAALGAQWVTVPDRDHRTAVSARSFKRAALDFLAAE